VQEECGSQCALSKGSIRWHRVYIRPTDTQTARMMMVQAALAYALLFASTHVCASSEDEGRKGHTFVTDDLFWLTCFILTVILLIWAYCAAFQTSEPIMPCNHCTHYPYEDPVIHVKIDHSSIVHPSKTRTSRDALTKTKSLLEGDPSAPPYPQSTGEDDDPNHYPPP
jgi:hypothetical protein